MCWLCWWCGSGVGSGDGAQYYWWCGSGDDGCRPIGSGDGGGGDDYGGDDGADDDGDDDAIDGW